MVNYTLDVRTVTPHFPGIGRYVRNLADHMIPQLRADESLTLLTQTVHPFAAPTPSYGESQVQTVNTSATPFSLKQQWSIPRLLRKRAGAHTSQLYHSPYYLMPYVLPYATVLTVYDVIALIHPQAVSRTARSLFRITTKLALRASDHIITISDATRRDLLSAFDVDPRMVTTVALAADEAFSPRSIEEQQKLRGAHNLNGDFILYFGINKPHKNLVCLIDAYAAIRANSPSPPSDLPALIIAGAWDNRYPEAKSRATYHRLDDSVRFLGPIDDADLPALYSAATALIFPSRYEGFGLPILEAMACGTPVACGHTSSLPEVAGDAAFYFNANDTDSIAQAIRALTVDGGLRNTLSDLGLRQAQKFSWTRTASETLDIYRSLVHSVAG